MKLCYNLIPLCYDEDRLPIKIFSTHNFEVSNIVGTSTEITPVIQINNSVINNGKPGPVTRKLQRTFLKLIQSNS